MKLRSILTFSPSIPLSLRGLRVISLLTVILLVGCAPASTPEPVQPEAPAQTENEPTAAPLPTATAIQPETAPSDASATEVPSIEAPTEAPTEVPQVVATSRGPNLEASDPGSYTRASGGLQLVEFFAFW